MSMYVPESYLEMAAPLDQALVNEFGPSVPLPALEASQLYAPFDTRLLTTPYAHNPEYRVAELADNIPALVDPASVGQVVAVRRPVTVQNRQAEVINPAILQGASRDGTGVAVTLLLDPLPKGDPRINDTQDVLLRTSAALNKPGVGDASADTVRASGATAASETGHTYLGLRTVTDPALIGAITAGQHPVHGWAAKGVAETVTQRDATKPGMFDARLPDGRVRKIVPVRRILRAGDGSAVLTHPAYKGETAYDLGLPPERVALAIGIKAAETTTERPAIALQGDLFRALESVNGKGA